ncbi:uncharacterized protein BP5553_07318 [Venustampulla echinocandica]|uniref:FAD-binding FR-type domain-containing protein n=1 Tax=Venustampulla echinocandica TaxID=2656787 RepID=A0A370TJ51_9HELO|nr:uncharacterized protein BP5553_07318 [Venustampulla echinocandica]RDL35387.1 hypothetical protein BP5553_07318 [Venustampulla echinocandica]
MGLRLSCQAAQLSTITCLQQQQRSNNNLDSSKYSRPVKEGFTKNPLFKLALLALPISILIYQYRHGWHDSNNGPFNPPKFTPFEIVKREEVSPTSILLTLRPISKMLLPYPLQDPYKLYWERGTWSVEVKQPELQIARSYTPLPSDDEEHPADLRFLIRKEKKGEVSGYLHNLPLNGKVELRGPNPEVDIPEEVEDVVFLAGGTGIAPALQVVYTLLERRNAGQKPKIQIIWANRTREDCRMGGNKSLLQSEEPVGLVVRMLEELQRKHPENLEVTYLVDEENTFIDRKKICQVLKTRSDVRSQPISTRIDSKLLFVSGPEGFINYNAGPKKWEGGKEGQGELGGILGRMRVRDWKIWKL